MKITKATHNGIDSDGYASIDVQAIVENETNHAIELIKSSIFVINKEGFILFGETDQENEAFVDPKESDSFDFYTSGEELKIEDLDKSKVLLCANFFRKDG